MGLRGTIGLILLRQPMENLYRALAKEKVDWQMNEHPAHGQESYQDL